MIQIELSRDTPWPDHDWDALALRAATAAIERTPHGELLTSPATIEISIRLAADEEVHTLNKQYRQKDKSTNVLSFPMVQPDLLDGLSDGDDGETLLGDIVLAFGVTAAEAADKGVGIEEHATHLIVHGTLHLLGYDHEQGEAEAEHMEELERAALAVLGFSDPYAVREA